MRHHLLPTGVSNKNMPIHNYVLGFCFQYGKDILLIIIIIIIIIVIIIPIFIIVVIIIIFIIFVIKKLVII